MYQNAKKYFITATESISASELISKQLGVQVDAPLLIKTGGVWLDKKRIDDPAFILNKGQTLRVYIAPTQGKRYFLKASQIIFETDDFIIVHKPAGLTVSSDRSNAYYNLTTAVGDWFKRHKNSYSPTPITRLDFMVEGLVLFPKHKKAEIDFFRLTQKRFIHKQYLALVQKSEALPKCKRIKDTLDFTHRCVKSPEGKDAHSLFMRRKESEHWDIYSVFLFTGRRHQIRFHASQYLSPLIGDTFYGSKIKTTNQQIGLFAYQYQFKYKGVRYKIRLPEIEMVLDKVPLG